MKQLNSIANTKISSIGEQKNLRQALRKLADILYDLNKMDEYGTLLSSINELWGKCVVAASASSELDLKHMLQDWTLELGLDISSREPINSQTSKPSKETLIAPVTALPAVPMISDEDTALIKKARDRVSSCTEKSYEQALALVALGDLLSKQNTTTAEARECYRDALTILITQEKPAPISALLNKLISLPEQKLDLKFTEQENN